MTARDLLNGAAGVKVPVGPAPYGDDVFSADVYTGNGTAKTVTTDVDLDGKGGMLWIKHRGATFSHTLQDTGVGISSFYRNTNSTSADQPSGVGTVTTVSGTGFSVGTGTAVNNNTGLYAAYSFAKAQKFFDVVTYVGTGVGVNKPVQHSLGVTPGMIVVKSTSAIGDWAVWHRSLAAGNGLALNTTALSASSVRWGVPYTAPTDSEFTVSDLANTVGVSYVAYVFAHDTDIDGIAQCGTFTLAAGKVSVNLGWEPQFLLVKSSSVAGNWQIMDEFRGLNAAGGERMLYANTNGAETLFGGYYLNANGFSIDAAGSDTYVYLAIRRSNKPPADGNKIFMPALYTGNNVDNRLIDTTIPPDLVWMRRLLSSTMPGVVEASRLTGDAFMLTAATNVEATIADAMQTPTVGYGNAFSAMNGVGVGNNTFGYDGVNVGTVANAHLICAFKRAVGVFDSVCYTGTGVAKTEAHKLGAVPELIIVKRRTVAAAGHFVYFGEKDYYMLLNSNAVKVSSVTHWNNTAPTSTVFSVGTPADVNAANGLYIAHLFATKPGISKVGSYSGNGGVQLINCGFTTGCRFVLIKSPAALGHWALYDSARNNMFYTAVSSTQAEQGGSVSLEPTGFRLNTNEHNASGTPYIYLAFA